VIPGLILGSLCFLMKEPRRGSTAAPGAIRPAPSYRAVVRELARNRSFVICCAGMTASTFVLGGVATVMQLYIYEREARFVLDDNAIRKLREDERVRRSAGTLVVPVAVIAKLEAATGPDVMTSAEARAKLQETL